MEGDSVNENNYKNALDKGTIFGITLHTSV